MRRCTQSSLLLGRFPEGPPRRFGRPQMRLTARSGAVTVMRGCFVDYADPRGARRQTRHQAVDGPVGHRRVRRGDPELDGSGTGTVERTPPGGSSLSPWPSVPRIFRRRRTTAPARWTTRPASTEPQAQEPADSKPSNAVPVIRRKARRGRLVSKIATSRVDGPSTLGSAAGVAFPAALATPARSASTATPAHRPVRRSPSRTP